jgi:aminoglycoside 2''-phosphotransferase
VDTITNLKKREFNQQAEMAVREYCRKVRELTFIEHGGDNLIIIANRQLVFRFPRDEAASRRLYFETALLQRIAGKITSFAIPKIVKVHGSTPLFVVAEYIEGMHLSVDQVQRLSESEQQTIGRSVADFVAELQHALSGQEVTHLRNEAGVQSLHGPWESYFAELFETQPLPNAKLRPLVDEYYPLWKEYVSHEQRTLAIHDDLHFRNLLFTGSELCGILDFGDANCGGIEEEMRWLYLMGDTVLDAAIAHYQERTGNSVARDHVRVWAITQELATYVYGLAHEHTQEYPFQRASANLKRWLPQFPI